MNIADTFIKRPVMTTLVMPAIVLFGALAYSRLPVSDLPNVDFPTISVTASLPGASPRRWPRRSPRRWRSSSRPSPGIDSMTSVSALRAARTITLQFALDRDIDAAAQDVQSAIAKALRRLPPTCRPRRRSARSNPADSPILFLALSSDTLPLSEVNEYAETFLAQRHLDGQRRRAGAGVRRAEVRGAGPVDPTRLAARGIGIDEVADGDRAGERQPADRRARRARDQAFTMQRTGQLDDGAGSTAT